MNTERRIVSVKVSDDNLTASYNGTIGIQLDICLKTILNFILGLRGGKA